MRNTLIVAVAIVLMGTHAVAVRAATKQWTR